MLKALVIIYCVSIIVKCENDREKREFERRQPKLFSFNVANEDVSIDLQFSIPFLKIPVKKTIDSAYGMIGLPTININPASLALGGAVVLGTTVILPFLAKQYAHNSENFRYAKLIKNAEFSSDTLLDLGQRMLMNSDGFGGCSLRLACWAAQNDIADPRAILSQITNNKLLSAMVNSSSVEDALISGLHGRSCNSYSPCPIQEHHMPLLMSNLALFTNAPDIY